jgi:hypothetical protein
MGAGRGPVSFIIFSLGLAVLVILVNKEMKLCHTLSRRDFHLKSGVALISSLWMHIACYLIQGYGCVISFFRICHSA